jgi:hypothetical protein
MTQPTKETLRAAVKEAEAELSRVRAARAEGEADGSHERVTEATTALERARVAAWVFEATGQVHGLVVRDDEVVGSVAVKIPGGSSQEARAKLVDAAVVEALADKAASIGAIVAAAPGRFTRERPGRDDEGRTVLDVRGRLEGDRLVPAVSRASSKASRRR